jgi:uncharacterized protein YegJ (DUF2314 family)
MPAGTRLILFAVALAGCTRGESSPRGSGPEPSPATSVSAPAEARARTHPIPRPPAAVAELGVLTERPKEELTKLFAPSALPALLEPRFCGPEQACNAVRAFVGTQKVEVSVVPIDDWGLPPESTLEHVARGLTREERASLHKKTAIVVVHARGAATAEQLPARAAFGLAAAIATRLRGFVYDETLRRIETADAFAGHAILENLGDPVYRGDRVVIQLYQQDDGSARLISLGMRRFGASDLEVRGAQMGAGKSLGNVMNAVAFRLAGGAADAPLTITLDDVARATRQPTADLHRGAAAPVAQEIDLVVPPPQQGDPDNPVLRLVPPGGDGAQGYDGLATGLFGTTERLVDVTDDPSLELARQRAVHAFPAALARWRAMRPRGALLVKLPFAVPGDAGPSAGGVESMWVELKSADGPLLTGSLANSPALIPDLKQGAQVKGARKDLEDWLLKLPDGGTEGGETIRILERR